MGRIAANGGSPSLHSVVAPQSFAPAPLPSTKDLASWRGARIALVREWSTILGPSPIVPHEEMLETIAEDRKDGVVRKLVRYLVEPETAVEAYLLLPEKRTGRLPGVVVFHSTIDYNIRQPAGLEGPSDKYIGLALAKRGFVTLCPRCFIYDYGGKRFQGAVDLLKELHPGWTGMGKMLYDGQRALDVLESLPEVDRNRLGAIGHSLGAKEALYLAAFDNRIKAAVSSEGGVGLSFSNWEAGWYLGDQIKRPDFRHDHHELLALCAPRPFLLIGGDSADGKRSQPYIEAARTVYKLYDKPDEIKLLNHGKGHEFPEEAQVAAWEWLERTLK